MQIRFRADDYSNTPCNVLNKKTCTGRGNLDFRERKKHAAVSTGCETVGTALMWWDRTRCSHDHFITGMLSYCRAAVSNHKGMQDTSKASQENIEIENEQIVQLFWLFYINQIEKRDIRHICNQWSGVASWNCLILSGHNPKREVAIG